MKKEEQTGKDTPGSLAVIFIGGGLILWFLFKLLGGLLSHTRYFHESI